MGLSTVDDDDAALEGVVPFAFLSLLDFLSFADIKDDKPLCCFPFPFFPSSSSLSSFSSHSSMSSYSLPSLLSLTGPRQASSSFTFSASKGSPKDAYTPTSTPATSARYKSASPRIVLPQTFASRSTMPSSWADPPAPLLRDRKGRYARGSIRSTRLRGGGVWRE